MRKEKYYSILNYGCQMNESDAEHYAGQLEELGYARTEELVRADVILVNTCCIRESAELKILGKIGELKRVKKIGELKRVKAQHPGQIICVAGCMAQKDGAALVKKYPQIDLLLGTSYVNSFKQILQDYLEERKKGVFTSLEVQSSEFEGQRVRESGFSAWIPIMYGCNNFCTYCIVPYVRGRERSRSIENILEEVRSAVAAGYKEITLLGQNVDSYGKDFLRNHEEEKLLSRRKTAVRQQRGGRRFYRSFKGRALCCVAESGRSGARCGEGSFYDQPSTGYVGRSNPDSGPGNASVRAFPRRTPERKQPDFKSHEPGLHPGTVPGISEDDTKIHSPGCHYHRYHCRVPGRNG